VPYRITGQSVPSADETQLGLLRSRHDVLFGDLVVERHDGGLLVRTRGEERSVRFDAIDEIWMLAGTNGVLEAIVLVEFDARRTRIPMSLRDSADIVAALDRECTIPLTRDAKAALARGERLAFGSVTIDRDTVEGHGWSHRFRTSRGVRIILGRLVFLHAEHTLDTIDLSAVPHPRVLMRLLEHLGPRIEIDGPPPLAAP
jgi:hypothetical protein